MGILANIVSKTALAGVEATGHSAEPHPLIRIGLGLLRGLHLRFASDVISSPYRPCHPSRRRPALPDPLPS